MEKLELVAAGGISPVRTDPDLVDLVTLTLKFDLLLNNFNLGDNCLTRSDRAVILHLCIGNVTRPVTWF